MWIFWDMFREEMEKEKNPQYPVDKDGKPFENSSKKKHRMKKVVSKAGKVSDAIRTWWSTKGIELNWAEYEELDEDFWRALVNLIRDGTPWHLWARVLGVAEDRVEYWIDHWASFIDEDNSGIETFARKVIVKDEILKMEAQMESDALDAINASIKRGNTKTSLEYLERLKDREKRFHDRAEYRQIAKDYGMTEKEYVWCLNVLNGISQAKASEMAGRPKNLNMYHYRMNPKVKEFIAVVKAARRKEIVESVPFSKETAQQAMSYVMWTLLDEMEKDDNTKADVIKITKEIRDTAVEMWKATSMYPKEEEKQWTTNIAILAWENTEAVLEMLGRKHNTNALNITQFANDRGNQGTANIETIENIGWEESEVIEWGATTGTEE